MKLNPLKLSSIKIIDNLKSSQKCSMLLTCFFNQKLRLISIPLSVSGVELKKFSENKIWKKSWSINEIDAMQMFDFGSNKKI